MNSGWKSPARTPLLAEMNASVSALGNPPCREKTTTRSNVNDGCGSEQTLTISSSVWNGTVTSE